jgi:hypothetical protein
LRIRNALAISIDEMILAVFAVNNRTAAMSSFTDISPFAPLVGIRAGFVHRLRQKRSTRTIALKIRQIRNEHLVNSLALGQDRRESSACPW